MCILSQKRQYFTVCLVDYLFFTFSYVLKSAFTANSSAMILSDFTEKYLIIIMYSIFFSFLSLISHEKMEIEMCL